MGSKLRKFGGRTLATRDEIFGKYRLSLTLNELVQISQQWQK